MRMASIFIAMALTPAALAAEPPSKDDDIKTLAEWQTYVGGWRGAGQVERGSVKGAWAEKADWAWKFRPGHASLEFLATDAKHIATGEISAAKEPGQFELSAQIVGVKEPAKFVGRKNDQGQFVFDRVGQPADNNPSDVIARITFRQVAEGNRLLVLYERQASGENRYSRVAEVGYTRQGIQFAAGSTGPECVVTGGRGTIPVSFQGQTYYVCCTGCKDLFEADPAGVLAEYKAKKAKAATKSP